MYPDLGDGEINIWIDQDSRNIVIEDNATGIEVTDFQRVLGSIADSDKKIGEDKDFEELDDFAGLRIAKN